jgi:hypothetical protein
VGGAVLDHRDLAAEQLRDEDLAVLAEREVRRAEESSGREFDVPVVGVHSVDLSFTHWDGLRTP